MANKRVKLVALLVAASVVMGSSQATISSSLDSMWYSSAGGTTVGQNNMGIYGPSISLRSPNKTLTVAYFDPPRFSAGCSGIDMSFGSFGALTADAFKDLVRKIMQAAPGYLMQLAIKSMCDDCQSILANLQNLANVTNSGQLNSCRIASQVSSALFKDFTSNDNGGENTKAQMESYESAVGGYVSNVWSSLNNLFKNPKGNRAPAENTSTDYGNTFFNTFYTNKGNERFDFGVFGTEAEGMQIIQSLIGTKIYRTSTESGAGNATLDDGWHGATLDFDDLVYGQRSDVKKNYLACNLFEASATGCQSIDPNKEYTYIGVKRYLMEKFAGAQFDAEGKPSVILTQIHANSILDKYRKGVNLEAAEMSVLRRAPVQLQYIMVRLVRMSEETQVGFLDQAFNLMADHIAASIGMSIASTVRQVYQPKAGGASKRTVTLTEAQERNLAQLENSARIRGNIQQRHQNIMALAERVNQARSLMTSPLQAGF